MVDFGKYHTQDIYSCDGKLKRAKVRMLSVILMQITKSSLTATLQTTHRYDVRY
jgi:hypothetical protein